MDSMIRIAISPKIEQKDFDETVRRMSRLFGESEAQRLRKITNPNALSLSLGGLSALELLCDGEKNEIARTPLGKPYFARNSERHFNISHSENLAAAALGAVALGIDIELIGRRKEPKRVARRFFTESEYAEFEAKGKSEESFIYLWTKKEAYAKYLGTGLARELPIRSEKVFFKCFTVEFENEKYLMTLCAGRDVETELSVMNGGIVISVL